MTYDYDLLVLGAGSGGLAAAKSATSFGKKVAIIEGDKVGGTCVIRGCVPKKIMSYAGDIADTLVDAAGYGFDLAPTEIDFASFAAKRNAEIDRLGALHIRLLKKAGVDLITGFGSLTDPHEITVNGTAYSAAHIILATGAAAVKPNIPGSEHCLTSDDIWQLTALPKSITIIGAGYIGLEFASIFNALGSEVTVVLRKDKILRSFDDDCRAFLQTEMAARGIRFITGDTPSKFVKTDSNEIVTYLDSNNTLTSEKVLLATGRNPNLSFLNKNLDLKISENKFINVNEYLQTSSPSVYAVGDLINRPALTPIAIKHGRMITKNLYDGTNLTVDDNSPSAVFTTPPVGVVGLSETDANAQGINTKIYQADFKPMRHQLSGRAERALMKMIVNADNGKVIGLHMVGRDAPEIIQGFAVAVRAGLTKADFDATVAIHPSSAEEFVLMK